MENNSLVNASTLNSTGSNDNGSSAPYNIPEYKIVLYCILLVFSLVGNTLVAAVILYNKDLKNSFNYLVLSMTLSDLLCPLVSLPVRIYIATGVKKWPGGLIGDILCKLCYFIIDISPSVSVFTLVAVASERFSATNSNRLYVVNKKKTCLIILFTWVLATAIHSIYFYGYRVNAANECELDIKGKYLTLFYIVLIVAVFVIPFVSIITLYSLTLIKICRASKDLASMLDSRLAHQLYRRNQRIFRLSVAIIAAFAVFWGPFFAFLFVWTIVWRFRLPSGVDVAKISSIVDILGLTHSCVNPCIYFSFQNNYRQGLRRIWRRVITRRYSGRHSHDYDQNVNLTGNLNQQFRTVSTKL